MLDYFRASAQAARLNIGVELTPEDIESINATIARRVAESDTLRTRKNTAVELLEGMNALAAAEYALIDLTRRSPLIQQFSDPIFVPLMQYLRDNFERNTFND